MGDILYAFVEDSWIVYLESGDVCVVRVIVFMPCISDGRTKNFLITTMAKITPTTPSG